jgi:hypothetical protein
VVRPRRVRSACSSYLKVALLRHGADALASALPNAQRVTMDGQDHGPAAAALIPALQAYFLG